MPSPKAETDWRARLEPGAEETWMVEVFLEDGAYRLIRNLDEPTARLIATAPAKEKLCEEQKRQIEEWEEGCLFDAMATIKACNELCEELAYVLEQTRGELIYMKEKLPYSNAASTLRIVNNALAKTKAGRAPR